MADNNTTKERLKEITDSIETGINELFESDRYMQYLRTMSRFHSYSLNNTLLLFHLIGGRGNDFDTTFNLFHMAGKLVTPLVEACHKGGIGFLHSNEQGVVKGIAMKS